MRLLSSYGPWVALLAAASLGSTRTTAEPPSTASDYGVTEQQAEADVDPAAPAPTTVRARLDLAPTQVELDATLHDRASPPSCAGTPEKSVALVLEHVNQRYERPYALEDVHLRASFGPLDVHVETPWCQRTCVGKGDATGHHYGYVCTCWGDPFRTSMEVHVRNRVVYAIETYGMPDMGRREVKGVWSVPCGARLRYPAGTQIVNGTGDDFDLAPEEERAQAAMFRNLGH